MWTGERSVEGPFIDDLFHHDCDEDNVDETILALLWLTRWDDDGPTDELSVVRTWKGHDFGHTNRLHEKGYISDPQSEAKSVILTDEGRARAQELFEERFGVDEQTDAS